MLNKKSMIAVLTATTFLTAGAAYAADQSGSPQTSAPQKAADQDFGKLSASGAKAYMEVNAARVAIFDGRTNDAKTLINKADADIGSANGDATAFMKAEADMKGSKPAQAGPTGAAASKNNAGKLNADDQASAADMKTPKQWLPVDGEMSVDEDLSVSPAKQAAAADANKSLAKGDKKGALEKLKVADINVDYAVAVVPLKQTIDDVHQAATLVNSGKYYEASQMLRDVQDSTRFDVLDISGVPKPVAASNAQFGEARHALSAMSGRTRLKVARKAAFEP